MQPMAQYPYNPYLPQVPYVPQQQFVPQPQFVPQQPVPPQSLTKQAELPAFLGQAKDWLLNTTAGRGVLGGAAGAGLGATISTLSKEQRKHLIRNALIGLVAGAGLGVASNYVTMPQWLGGWAAAPAAPPAPGK